MAKGSDVAQPLANEGEGLEQGTPIDAADDAWIAGWNRTLQINLTAAAALCRLAVLHWQVGGRSGRFAERGHAQLVAQHLHRGAEVER